MKAMYIRFAIWFVILFGLGLLSYFLTRQWFQMEVSMAVFCAVVLFNLAWVWNTRRLIRYSTNVKQIERLLHRRRKHPLPGCIFALVHRDYATARKLASRIRDPESRAQCLASVALSENRWDEAEALLSKVQDEEFKKFIRAMMALKQRDWSKFNALKANISDEETARILEVEEAYARGELERADQLGEEVIQRAKGLTRYILVKGLELNQENPHRDSYF